MRVIGTGPPGGWKIALTQHSRNEPDNATENVLLPDGGLATSGVTYRCWSRGGATVHHIIDPKTGAPAITPWRTATVIAGTCVDANIASTSAIILGDAAPKWLAERRLAARLVAQDESVQYIAGWPKPGVVMA